MEEGGGGGEKRILFMVPSWSFPCGRWRRPCEVNTDTVYFPELCKPSVAPHKVKVKEPNLLYRFTQLSAATPHIWRLPVTDTEICHSQRMPHGALCCIFKFQWNMKVDYDKWAGTRGDVSSSDAGERGIHFLSETTSDAPCKTRFYEVGKYFSVFVLSRQICARSQ